MTVELHRGMVTAFIALDAIGNLHRFFLDQEFREERKTVLEIELIVADLLERFGPRYPPHFRQPSPNDDPAAHLSAENKEVDRFEEAKDRLIFSLCDITETDEAFTILPPSAHQQLHRLRALLLRIPVRPNSA